MLIRNGYIQKMAYTHVKLFICIVIITMMFPSSIFATCPVSNCTLDSDCGGIISYCKTTACTSFCQGGLNDGNPCETDIQCPDIPFGETGVCRPDEISRNCKDETRIAVIFIILSLIILVLVIFCCIGGLVSNVLQKPAHADSAVRLGSRKKTDFRML